MKDRKVDGSQHFETGSVCWISPSLAGESGAESAPHRDTPAGLPMLLSALNDKSCRGRWSRNGNTYQLYIINGHKKNTIEVL
jgi:hypothetical protein